MGSRQYTYTVRVCTVKYEQLFGNPRLWRRYMIPAELESLKSKH